MRVDTMLACHGSDIVVEELCCLSVLEAAIEDSALHTGLLEGSKGILTDAVGWFLLFWQLLDLP